MKVLLFAILGTILGYVAGVVLGLTFECSLSPNPSNLCGLVALMWWGPIAAAVGLAIGLTTGFLLSGPKTPKV